MKLAKVIKQDITSDQKELYDEILQSLPDKNSMTLADKHLLVAYVQIYDLWSKSMIQVINGNTTQEFNSGVRQISPEYTIMRNSMNDMIRLQKELGLTTISKLKLKIDNVDVENDPLDEL